MYTKRVCKGYVLGDYHNLYFKSNAILLADVFENFWKMVEKIMN